MKIARAIDSIFCVAVDKTPAQIAAEKWLEENPDEFVTWHPSASDYTYSDFPDAVEASPPPPKVVSGLDASWPESVGHPGDFHPVFRDAGFNLHVNRWEPHDGSYSRSSAPPVEGGSSGQHIVYPSHDSTTPWAGLNTYGPWSGGVGHYATPEEAVNAMHDDERRYVDHFRANGFGRN